MCSKYRLYSTYSSAFSSIFSCWLVSLFISKTFASYSIELSPLACSWARAASPSITLIEIVISPFLLLCLCMLLTLLDAFCYILLLATGWREARRLLTESCEALRSGRAPEMLLVNWLVVLVSDCCSIYLYFFFS